MAEERIRLVLCMGVDCNDSGRARPLRKLLESWLAQHPGRNVKLEFASCLTHCAQGPNLLCYPGGTVNHRLNTLKLEAFLNNLGQ
ncbi:MAG: (2Fe-2S) ferredoxin domain-containing protein [Anaerolineae bacterium]|nr:(2Fe-2S) ferredoxin domain-containing protein [Anaerolineae bacterium]